MLKSVKKDRRIRLLSIFILCIGCFFQSECFSKNITKNSTVTIKIVTPIVSLDGRCE